MSNAMLSEGAIVKRGNGGAPETFTAIGEVVSFQGPGGSAAVIDVTHLLSTAKEKRIGLPDEGQVTMNLNAIPSDAQQTAMRVDRKNRTLRNFQIVLTDAGLTTLSFSAYVLEFTVAAGVDEKVALTVTLEISGLVTGWGT